MHDLGLSSMAVVIGSGDTAPQRVSLTNEPDDLELDGRENYGDLPAPQFTEKEIVAINGRIAAKGSGDSAATGPPAFEVQKLLSDTEGLQEPFNGPSRGFGAMETKTIASFYGETGDPYEISNVAVSFEEPIHWPAQDQIHLVGVWNDSTHGGVGAQLRVQWRER